MPEKLRSLLHSSINKKFYTGYAQRKTSRCTVREFSGRYELQNIQLARPSGILQFFAAKL